MSDKSSCVSIQSKMCLSVSFCGHYEIVECFLLFKILLNFTCLLQTSEAYVFWVEVYLGINVVYLFKRAIGGLGG